MTARQDQTPDPGNPKSGSPVDAAALRASRRGQRSGNDFGDDGTAPGEGRLDAAVHRRLTVAVCWAVSRRATLDSRELYEESFALNEEFREWLLCLEDHPGELQRSVLIVPSDLALRCRGEESPESDGLLEI